MVKRYVFNRMMRSVGGGGGCFQKTDYVSKTQLKSRKEMLYSRLSKMMDDVVVNG